MEISAWTHNIVFLFSEKNLETVTKAIAMSIFNTQILNYLTTKLTSDP